MTANNPFKLQTDNKRFFFDVANKTSLEVIPEFTKSDSGSNRIKNMAAELQQLAKQRQQILFKDSEINYIFKKQKPVIQLGDFLTSANSVNNKQKKFRVRALLKEKKESIHEFLQKKKQIYLSKMNINIKKQQTIKLQDAIKDQQQTLKARKLYFENDVQFMHKFIQSIKKQAQQAQTGVQNQLKIQQSLVSKLNSLQAQTQKIDNIISKQTQSFNNLKLYKQFIDSFYDPQMNWKPYVRKLQEDPLFMTQNTMDAQQKQNLTIKYQPQNFLQIFNNAEENNIRQMQNLHDKEDQVQTIRKLLNKDLGQLKKFRDQNQHRINLNQKMLQKKQDQNKRLKQMKKNNINKIGVFQNQEIDLEKVAEKVVEAFKQINVKRASQLSEGSNQKIMKRAMTQIQHEIQKLRTVIKRQKQIHPALINQVQRQIKQNQKRQTLLRKKQQAKQLELKKQREQQKKRNEPSNESHKGRKDMQKVLLQKKQVKKKQVNIKTVDESEKYFIAD